MKDLASPNIAEGARVLVVFVLFFPLIAMSPGAGAEDQGASEGCRGFHQGYVRIGDQVIPWKSRVGVDDHQRLLSWCKGVGPPVFLKASGSTQEPGSLDSLIIVSWNVHVGGGGLGRFIEDLRAGRLTDGKPVEHFVLLLQEVFRQGPGVPIDLPPGGKGGRPIRPEPPEGRRVGIVETAVKHTLNLFYVPFIRNGGPDDQLRPEDRGNAILSTLPLSDPKAVELPFERQRRVAISTGIYGKGDSGDMWILRIVNVHLENRARWRHVFQSFGSLRQRQITALLDMLRGEGALVVGGDFNTWYGESKEPVIQTMYKSFEKPSIGKISGTLKIFSLKANREVDYLFFRVPDRWRAVYQRTEKSYGSDHYPIVGRLDMTRPPEAARP